MSKCPDCGAENVKDPEGVEAHCGRRISWSSIAEDSTMDWKARTLAAEACKAVARKMAGDEAKATQ